MNVLSYKVAANAFWYVVYVVLGSMRILNDDSQSKNVLYLSLPIVIFVMIPEKKVAAFLVKKAAELVLRGDLRQHSGRTHRRSVEVHWLFNRCHAIGDICGFSAINVSQLTDSVRSFYNPSKPIAPVYFCVLVFMDAEGIEPSSELYPN